MSLVGTKRTFKVLWRRSDVEGRADMARIPVEVVFDWLEDEIERRP